MGGFQIPQYAKQFLTEWRKYDRLLRLRWSQDVYGAFILERKTRYLYPPAIDDIERGSDRAIQLTDEYRTVLRFWPNEIQHVISTLRRSDVQRLGAKAMANELDEQDARELDLIDRAMRAEFEAIASEGYDRIAWEEKRRVAVGNTIGG
jgi:hypothetical protein